MDEKMLFLHEVAYKVEKYFPNDSTSQFMMILEGVMKDYSIKKECYELTVDSNVNEKLLKLFVATRRLEGMSERTIKQYVYECKKFLCYLNKDLTDITNYDISFYLSEYERTHKIQRSSLDNMRRHLGGIFHWLEMNDYITTNPMRRVGRIAFKEKKVQILSEYEIQLLRNGLNGKTDKKSIRLRAIVEFLLATGMRVSELIGCEECNVDLPGSEVVIECAKKRNKETRTVFLTTEAKFYIVEYQKLKKERGWNNTCYLFQAFNSKGKKLDDREVNKELNELARDVGITDKHVTVHLFRKTLASRLYSRGMSPTDIAYILGHADVRTSEKYYISIEKDKIKSTYLTIM